MILRLLKLSKKRFLSDRALLTAREAKQSRRQTQQRRKESWQKIENSWTRDGQRKREYTKGRMDRQIVYNKRRRDKDKAKKCRGMLDKRENTAMS